MHAHIHTIPFLGTETTAVTVQIDIANGLPAMAAASQDWLCQPPETGSVVVARANH